MKAQTKSSVNKLLTSFDNELKNIIMSDLSALRNKANLVSAIHDNLNNRLKAA
ncbi:MAG: hypothetical protein V4592_12880 [Bacteroidota bacterium]